MLREFIELGRYRLDRGLTYRQLAAEINHFCEHRHSAFRISYSSLRLLLNDPKKSPNDLTLHAVREFIESVALSVKR